MIAGSRHKLLIVILSAVFYAWLTLLGGASAADCELKDIALARVVTTGARVNFIAGPGKQTPTCPSVENACRLKAFLVPGDEVLVGPAEGSYVCATFKSQAGIQTSGWLPRTALEMIAPSALSVRLWDGKWRRDREAEMVLKSVEDEVTAVGSATWGGKDPQRVKSGAVHTGELNGHGKPREQTLAIGYNPDRSGFPPAQADAPDGCAAQLTLYGRYLMVEDNGGCGGVNVSFTGLYVRVRPK